MIKEAIILAGGKGTRLQSVVSDVPKPMAEIDGKPFLYYLLKKLQHQGIERVIISVGYLKEVIIDYFGKNFENIEIIYASETQALGTGGGIKYAISFALSENVLVLNGDTFFDIDFQKLCFVHEKHKSLITFALHKTHNNNRYGGVEMDDFLKIINFREKDFEGDCFINAGIYIFNKPNFETHTVSLLENFSLEEDFFKLQFDKLPFYGVPYFEKYFIDIGIPDDFYRSKIELPLKIQIDKLPFNTLFLDRDGVVNEKIENGYVLNWKDFKFKNGFLHSLSNLNRLFKKTILITNQRCVGRGILDLETLNGIHEKMLFEINKNGGNIDKIYFCPDLDVTSPCRKPNDGMILQAREDFSEIDLNANSYLIGDSITDLIPAKKNNLTTVFITNYFNSIAACHFSDFCFESVKDFEEYIAAKTP